MTSPTTPPAAAPPHSGDSAPTDPQTPAAILYAQATAWRHVTHALGVELRRRLIPLVRARLFPLDVACRVLQAAGLPPLPRMWTVQLAPNLSRHTHSTSPERAVTEMRDGLHQAVRQAVRQALDLAATITFEQPPQALAAGPRDESGRRPYHILCQPVITATVRAETSDQAHTTTVALLRAGLPGVDADLADPGVVYVDPDPHCAVELDVDTDGPHQPYTPPLVYGAGGTIEAGTARRLAMQAWQHLVRQIRAALIDVLLTGDIDEQPGRHAPYGLIDDLLRELGLPGLPHAHLYEIATVIPVTVAADTPAVARLAAYRLMRDASTTSPQYGLPITHSSTFRDPDFVAAGDGSYRVMWRETYLVCLRATHSPRLAEHAVRLQLSVLADELPDIATVPLSTVYLGEHIDHRLDAAHD